MTYTEQEWFQKLRDCKKKHGEVTPSVFDNDDDYPSYTGAAKRFGSWARAKELAGVDSGEIDTCPDCGTRYRHLTKHWNNSECELATPSRNQMLILKGLLMGDGTLLRDGPNAALAVEMTNLEYLEWIDSLLGIFSTGVEMKHSAEEQLKRAKRSKLDSVRTAKKLQSSYLLLTRKHPVLNQFRGWYSTGQKVFPTELSLTPRIVRHWYCCDGTINIPKKAANPTASIICKNERTREERLVKRFSEVGFTPAVRDGRLRFSVKGTNDLLAWIGPAPPGFEYKWAQSNQEYRKLRSRCK